MHEIYFKPSPIDHNIGTLNMSNWTITLENISLNVSMMEQAVSQSRP